jgi:hypothetical protein
MQTALAQVIPLAFASGLNLYATIAVLGLSAHYGLVRLPQHFQAFDNPYVITFALGMYLVEFVADKIPWLDSVWDALHTVIRPLGGALVAATAMGDASSGMQTIAALVGGTVAMTTHLAKAGTRAAANTTPEPFSNWVLSFSEDVIAIGLTYFATQHPMIALAIALVLLGLIVAFASVLIRFARRRFRRRVDLPVS